MPKRFVVVIVSLFVAALACARAEVPITPATPQLQIVELIDTPTASAVGVPPSATTAATDVATSVATETPSPTSVIQLPPTETPTITETPVATDTAPPTNTRAPATATVRGAATATRVTTGPSPTAPPSGGRPQPIPANATLTQLINITYSGGTLFGETLNLIDRRTETWASIRESDGVFVLDLGAPQNVAGVRVYPKKDGNDPVRSVVTLLRVEVSLDGGAWTTVLSGMGDCGVPRCDTLTPGAYVDLGFTPTKAQYVRLVGGPTRFGFAEIAVAVLP
jgi:hypothetical protein